MGRKSVPFVDASALLRLHLREALEDESVAFSGIDEDEHAEDDSVTDSFRARAPAGLSFEDLYRRNRNRARLIGLLHTHRAYQGAQIIVVASEAHAAEREELHEGDAMAWFVKPIERDRLVHAALRLVH